jgi:hypothetical protein
MYHNGELSNYHGEDDTYIVPYNFVSYTGLMYAQDRKGVTKIWFDVYEGFAKNRIIVYTSDDSGISANDFIGELFNKDIYSDISKIDTNWYSATVSYY